MNKEDLFIEYDNEKLRLVVSKYNTNGALAMFLVDAKTEETYTYLSHNIPKGSISIGDVPSEDLPENECYISIKYHHDKIMDILESKNIITRTHYYVGYGSFNSRAELIMLNK